MKRRIFAIILVLTLVLGMIPICSAEATDASLERIPIASATGLTTASWASTFGLEKIYDNDRSSFFVGESYTTEDLFRTSGDSLTLTFNGIGYVSEVNLYTRIADEINAGCPEEFTISAFTNEGWTTVATGNDDTLTTYQSDIGLIQVSFPQVLCSKLKITITECGMDGSSYCVRLNEAEVYGQDYTELEKIPIASASGLTGVTWTTSFPLSNIYDGNTTTMFAGASYSSVDALKASGDSLVVTFDGTAYVSEVDLYTRIENGANTGRPTSYTVSAYTNSGWTQVAEGGLATFETYSESAGHMQVLFDKVFCTKIKITFTGFEVDANGNYFLRLPEVEVYGQDYTELEKILITSASGLTGVTWTTAFPISNIYDGDPTTMFAGASYSSVDALKASGDSLVVTFDGTAYVSEVDLYTRIENGANTGRPTSYTVSAYTNSGWTQVAEGGLATFETYSESAGHMQVLFDKVLCTKIKITFTGFEADANGNYFLRLPEVEVYGKAYTAPDDVYEMVVQPEITDSIALNYVVTVDSELVKAGDTQMTFEMEGRDTIQIKGTPTQTGGNVFKYTYTDIMPQDMAEPISVQVAVGTVTKTYEYSVLDYCEDVLQATTLYNSDGTEVSATKLAATKELIVDLVQYGAAVQNYRNDAQGELLTTKLSETVSNYEAFDLSDDDESALENLTGVSDKLTSDVEETGTGAYAWTSVGLVLNNKVRIRGTFIASDVSNLTVKSTIGSVEETLVLKQKATDTYQVDFDNVYAYEYGTEITLRFYEGDKQVGKTLHYSVDTYLKEMRADSEELTSLLVAIHNYGKQAIAYQAAQ